MQTLTKEGIKKKKREEHQPLQNPILLAESDFPRDSGGISQTLMELFWFTPLYPCERLDQKGLMLISTKVPLHWGISNFPPFQGLWSNVKNLQYERDSFAQALNRMRPLTYDAAGASKNMK